MIADRDALATTPARDDALACVEAGIRAAMPEPALERAVSLDGDALSIAGESYDLGAFDRVLVVGGGKAAAGLTRALVGVLGERVTDGVVLVPGADAGSVGPVELAAGGHPTPTAAGERATRRALALVRGADERTLVLAPVTGGGSALFAAPAEGVALDAVSDLTRALLDAGADIDEVNAVRRQVSAVKGGRLAAAAGPATVVGLLVSDVVGDDPAVVASGPTAPDPTTPANALAVLDRYGVDAPAVRAHLADAPGSPDPDHPAVARVRNVVLADGRTALAAAREEAADLGYDARVVSDRVTGEARACGRRDAALARAVRDCGGGPTVVLSGGETTVTVRGDGRGGPNCEYALAAGMELAEAGVGASVAVAAVDTDGSDGSTDAAGALVDGDTVTDATAARDALRRNDALSFLDGRGAIRTGATGTNVNDLRACVVTGNR